MKAKTIHKRYRLGVLEICGILRVIQNRQTDRQTDIHIIFTNINYMVHLVQEIQCKMNKQYDIVQEIDFKQAT